MQDLSPCLDEHVSEAPHPRTSSTPSRTICDRSGLLFCLLICLLLATVTLLVHGWSLTDGLFLDDHWHQRQLHDRGWSWSDLLNTTTLDPDRFMETWWQEKPIRWQYARPVSILVMKLVYVATGGSVVAQHAVSLLLHFINACLVYTLCVWLTRRRFWALVGGLLFVIYSHSVFAVGWLAAQNTVLMTTLMLAALMLYVRASGLRLFPGPASQPFGNPGSDPPTRSSDVTNIGQATIGPPPLRSGFFTGAIVLWVLALLTRENAVMLPALWVAFDLAFGGRHHARGRLRAYALMAILTMAFLYWRLIYFYHPLPDLYFRRPDGQGSYWLWCLAKLMHYLTSAVWLSPMTVGPTGRFNPFTEVPGDCLLMFAILTIMGTGYYMACRGARGWWIWPMWLVLSFLPVVPILATPHSGYTAGVGFSVAMVLGPGLRNCIRPVSIGRWSRPVAIWFLIATSIYIPIYRTLWRGMRAAEHYVPAKITAGPAPAGVSDIFFINLPFVNIYSKLCLEEVWGKSMESIRCHALTYAPDLLRMEPRCFVQQIDSHRFTVSVEEKHYFSGLLGRYLIDSVRPSGRFRTGDHISDKGFEVDVLEAGPHGVRKLQFTFQEPLDSDRFRFYLTTRQCAAARIHFSSTEGVDRLNLTGTPDPIKPLAKSRPILEDTAEACRRLEAGDSSAARIILAAMQIDPPDRKRRLWEVFRRVALPVAEAMGSPIQVVFDVDDPTPHDLYMIGLWWNASVNSEILDALWLHKNEFERIRQARDGVFTVRAIASTIIAKDLYLTGPPFPGPR